MQCSYEAVTASLVEELAVGVRAKEVVTNLRKHLARVVREVAHQICNNFTLSSSRRSRSSRVLSIVIRLFAPISTTPPALKMSNVSASTDRLRF